jgi:lambda repressor-like predicted transcriptional regulator
MDLRKELTKAAKESGAAREKRDSLIYKAHKSGMSLRQVADATDLSFQRVHQIIRRRIERFAQPAESIKAGAKPIPNSRYTEKMTPTLRPGTASASRKQICPWVCPRIVCFARFHAESEHERAAKAYLRWA